MAPGVIRAVFDLSLPATPFNAVVGSGASLPMVGGVIFALRRRR